MDKLFFWNSWHNGDIIFTRPLVRAVLDRHDVEIAWGCFHNHKYLIEDLPVRVLVDPRDDRHAVDLSYLCPEGFFPINTWLAQYPESRRCIWSSVVNTYNRQLEGQGLDHLKITSRWVPMVDFPHQDIAVNEDAIFVANGGVRSGQSAFDFDMGALAREFPRLTFYCIAHPDCVAANLVDCSSLNLVQMSAISNRCDALIGKPGGAYDCTFTEPNRMKPRAVMGLSNVFNPTVWEYPGIRVQYLETQGQLREFLQEVMRRPKVRLKPGAHGVPIAASAACQSDALLKQVKDAIRQYVENKAEPASFTTILRARQRVARILAATAAADLAAFFTQDDGLIYQELLDLRLCGTLVAELRLSMPLDNSADSPEEWAWVRGLVAPAAGGGDDCAALPRMMAAMLYLEAHEISGWPDLSFIPPWFHQMYLDFILCPPRFQRRLEAGEHAACMARWSGYLAENILQHPQSAQWRDAGFLYLQRANLLAAQASAVNLKELARHRAGILERVLLDCGAVLEHAFPARPPERKRIRLGLLVRHLVPQPAALTAAFTNGEFKVLLWNHRPMSLPAEWSALYLACHLDRNLFDVTLFCIQPRSAELGALGDAHVIYLPPDLPGQAQAIRQRDLDLLFVAGDITATVHPVTLLALHRLARRQIVSGDCPATTGMRHVDYFISGEAVETPPSQEHYAERLVLIPGQGRCHPDLLFAGGAAAAGVTRQMAHLGANDIVFACGANYYRYTAEMMESWVRILQAVPNSRLLLYPFNPTRLRNYPLTQFVHDLERQLLRQGLTANRMVILAPMQNRADIAQRLKLADVYLDAFPFSGFHTVIEALEAGLPVVSLEGDYARGRRGAALLRELEMPELIAHNEEEYVQLAVRLGTEAAFRAQASRRIDAAMRRGPRFLDQAWYAAEMQKAFCRIAAEVMAEAGAASAGESG